MSLRLRTAIPALRAALLQRTHFDWNAMKESSTRAWPPNVDWDRSAPLVALALLAGAFVCGCSGSPTEAGPPPPSGAPRFAALSVSPESVSVAVGSTAPRPHLQPLDQYGHPLSGVRIDPYSEDWTIGDTVRASLAPRYDGSVLGAAPGTTDLTVTLFYDNSRHTGVEHLTILPSASGATFATGSPEDWYFAPRTVEIQRNGGVGSNSWTFADVAHTVHWDSQPAGATVSDIDSSTDAVVTRTFTIAGTYAYHCLIHPEMSGSIVVR